MDSIISVIGTYVSWDLKSLLLFTAVFIITADYIKNRRPAGYPPGPRGLPIMGNLFTIDQNRAHESMTQVPVNLKILHINSYSHVKSCVYLLS